MMMVVQVLKLIAITFIEYSLFYFHPTQTVICESIAT